MGIFMFSLMNFFLSIKTLLLCFMFFGGIFMFSLVFFFENYFFFQLSINFDYISYMLIFLSFLILFVSLLLEFKKSFELSFYLIFLLMFILLNCFMLDSFFMFYIFFEFSLIPLILLMLILGGSMERFLSMMYLFLYTFSSSLLLLLVLFKMSSKSMMIFSLIYFCSNTGAMWSLMMLVFLVKTPLYIFHIWLPKAHVEGPTVCSMILAGVLLKLGGFGMIRLFYFLNFNSVKLLLNFLVIFSIWGALFGSLICMRQVDMKSLIAYSSVSHMGLMLGGLFSVLMTGMSFSVLMMVAHGFCSSGLFFLGNMIYDRCMSRNIYFYKGFYMFFPFILGSWLMFSVINMGSPPFLNFFCELILVICILKKNLFLSFLLFVFLFVSVFYSLNLFLRMGHGHSFLFFYFKKEVFNENLIIIIHYIFITFVIMKFSLFLLI
nr:NADH dehydrogenase subunit 4 [Amblyseius swirskii]